MNFALTWRVNNLSFLFICLVIGGHVKDISCSGYPSNCDSTSNCLPDFAPAPAPTQTPEAPAPTPTLEAPAPATPPTPEAPAPTLDGLYAEDIQGSDWGIPPRIDCTNLCLDCTRCAPILMRVYRAASVWFCTCNGKIYIPHKPLLY